MSNTNCTRVQATNDASTVSKCSAVSKNYFNDDFIQHFVDKKKTRASLIHLGYYTRAVIFNELLVNYLNFLNHQGVKKFQIISCGSGFDTTYWKLSDGNLLSENSIFVEIDFPNVIRRKISLIKHSQKLMSFLQNSFKSKFQGINQISSNYFLLEADLSDLSLIEKLLVDISIDFNAPTLFLSECVIIYMKEYDSSKLLHWMATKFDNSCLFNYEQIHPDDGFGKIMLRHFERLQSPLLSLIKYPNCESHSERYESLGFNCNTAISEWDAYIHLTTDNKRKAALSLELFDEFEEFHQKCCHYVVGIAGKGISCSWIKSQVFNGSKYFKNCLNVKNYVNCKYFDCQIECYRHSSCSSVGSIFLFGGCEWRSRSSKIYRIQCTDSLNVEPVEVIKDDLVQTDMVYGISMYFEINNVPYFCIHGGRNSPDKICNNGSAVIFELSGNKLVQRLTVTEGNPIPRYRHSMVTVFPSGEEVHCWLFGGRTVDLNILSDLNELTLKHDANKKLIYKWKKHKKEEVNWPCERMSHSCATCPKRNAFFVTGGLKLDSPFVLNDLWKWCCKSETWEKLELTMNILPRYGHSSHLVDDVLYLVGGVNTLAGRQPYLARIDLTNLSATEYALQVPDIDPVLFFNNTSEIVGDGNDAEILIFGGGGNCFSFGTHLNRGVLSIHLNQIT